MYAYLFDYQPSQNKQAAASTSRLLWRFGHLLRKIYYEYNSNICNDETHGMPSDLLSDRVWKKIMRRLWWEYA